MRTSAGGDHDHDQGQDVDDDEDKDNDDDHDDHDVIPKHENVDSTHVFDIKICSDHELSRCFRSFACGRLALPVTEAAAADSFLVVFVRR